MITNRSPHQGGSNLGPHILSALHSSAQNLQISALHRPSSTTKFPSYVTPISTDFTPSSLTAAFQDQDVVISVLGFDGLVEQNKMIDAAKEAGVKRFIPSEFGWSKDLPMVPELKARLKIKEDGFKYLVQKCEDGGMTWSALASGIFIDWVCDPNKLIMAAHLASMFVTKPDNRLLVL